MLIQLSACITQCTGIGHEGALWMMATFGSLQLVRISCVEVHYASSTIASVQVTLLSILPTLLLEVIFDPEQLLD